MWWACEIFLIVFHRWHKRLIYTGVSLINMSLGFTGSLMTQATFTSS